MKKLITTVLLFLATTCIDAQNCSNCSHLYRLESYNIRKGWCTGWEIAAEYLYWQPKRSNLGYAVVGNGTTVGNPVGNDAKTSSIKPDWGSGYRLELAKMWFCSQFDSEARYTRFCNTTSNFVSQAPSTSTSIFPTRANPPIQSAATTLNTTFVSGEYQLNYNVLDLLGGYTFAFGCDAVFCRPFAGVKLACIDEDFDSQLVVTSTTQEFKQHSDLSLCGLTLGCGGVWRYCDGLISLYARGASSLLYADIKRKQEELNGSGVTVTKVSSSTCQIVPEWELSVGLGSDLWCNSCFSLNVQIGYDFQGWIIPDLLYSIGGTPPIVESGAGSTNATFIFTAEDPNAFLALHGLHARVSILF